MFRLFGCAGVCSMSAGLGFILLSLWENRGGEGFGNNVDLFFPFIVI